MFLLFTGTSGVKQIGLQLSPKSTQWHLSSPCVGSGRICARVNCWKCVAILKWYFEVRSLCSAGQEGLLSFWKEQSQDYKKTVW